MQQIKGLRPIGCTGIVKPLLAAMLFATAGCAQLPRMDSPPSMRKVEQLGTANSFSAPAAAWPGDQWWQAYGDPQLNGLIEEALQGAPDLKLAQARLAAAGAVVRSAESTRIPEVTGVPRSPRRSRATTISFPRQALPRGWTDYGLATLNFSWELDFWGKNRSALAAALSDQQAAGLRVRGDASALVDLGRRRLCGPGRPLHPAGQRRRDPQTARGDGETVSAAARFWAGEPRERAPGGGATGLCRGRIAQLR